ncbi:MAG: glutamine--fructose-6-phosphate transaminase (isomerizing) [Chloroflexi bacterium]|nr:glutamine--fructose-6-phosphate transaminase (isomerizing) [Chloroflexota bacterium]
MCGIFGIVANEDFDLGKALIEAGKRLSYRGYDSVGCATVAADRTIDLRKDVGQINAVSERMRFDEMRGRRGIVQLRWATFGTPATRNAQPHLDCDGDMVGAHNGNIVNNVELREAFIAEGHTVRGENDGETCVHAVERHFDRCGDMVEAIRLAYADLNGDYAFVITHRDENRLYAIKKGSGLVVGLGDGVTCCSSDLPSILPITRRTLRVRDGEVVVLWPEGFELRSVTDGSVIAREPEVYHGGMAAAEKGGYPHFMLKEIHEQPQLAGELLHLLDNSTDAPKFVEMLRQSDPLFFVGCGTSYHACLLGAYYVNKLAGKVAVPALPQQFTEQYGNCLGKAASVVFVSQSGETKDVLNAVKVARARGATCLGMVNVIGSSLTHVTDLHLPLACGYEISVPATKTFLNQVIMFLYLADRLGTMTAGAGLVPAQGDHKGAPLHALPDLLARTIELTAPAAERVAARLKAWDDMYYLGYGLTHPIALEGALKLKEITYAHCEGIFSSEFKHGPLSAVRPGYPVTFITAPDDVEMMINHVNEVTCREGLAIAIAEEDERLRKNVNEYLVLPPAGQLLNPILATVAVQLVAYHAATARGIDPDFPRNLSKTLTVD